MCVFVLMWRCWSECDVCGAKAVRDVGGVCVFALMVVVVGRGGWRMERPMHAPFSIVKARCSRLVHWQAREAGAQKDKTVSMLGGRSTLPTLHTAKGLHVLVQALAVLCGAATRHEAPCHVQ